MPTHGYAARVPRRQHLPGDVVAVDRVIRVAVAVLIAAIDRVEAGEHASLGVVDAGSHEGQACGVGCGGALVCAEPPVAEGPYPRILDTGCDYAAVGSVAVLPVS